MSVQRMASLYVGRIKELEEQLQSAHRHMDRYGMALAVIADGGYGDASVKARAALNSNPAKSPFPPPPDLTVGAVDYLTQREDGTWESNQESRP